MLDDEMGFALANARILQAKDCLRHAEAGVAIESFKGAANRSYYAIFHAMRAVLALDGFDSKKHSGIIATFRQKYIKTGILPVELSDIVEDAFEVRNVSDYQDFYIISKEKVETQIANAKEFLAAVEAYVSAKVTPNS